MELHQLECFVRTAELMSFTKAATMLHISQPSLSKNIAMLEESLGVKLFDRNGKRFSLSAKGSQLLEHAQRILDHTQQITLLCQKDRHQTTPVMIRMMCVSELFPDILAGFRHLYPDIQVNLMSNVRTSAHEDSDILVFSSRQAHSYRSDMSVLHEELQMLIPKGHPLYDQTSVMLADIAKYPIISLRTETELRTSEDYYYNLAGISPKRDVECDNPMVFQSILRSGLGIAMVPARTWDVVSGTDNRLIPIRDYHCERYINVHIPHTDRASGNVQIFFDYLVGYFRNLAVGSDAAKGPDDQQASE